jgi:hypothetical protein
MASHETTDAGARRAPASSDAARVFRRGTAMALAALLATATAALAAAHFRPRAVYTGQVSGCSASGIPDTTCAFKFRASRDGRSLRFAGQTVIDTWRCPGGGGEALLGGRANGATPIPLVKVRKNGKLYGSASYTLRPTQAPPEHFKVTVTGDLAKSGKTAVIRFHETDVSGGGNRPCATQPVTLTAH